MVHEHPGVYSSYDASSVIGGKKTARILNGTIRGAVHAVVEGDIDLNLVSGSANDEEADDDETK